MRAALECIVLMISQKHVTEDQILDYFSSVMPPAIDIKIKTSIRFRVRNRIKLKLPPKIRRDGLLIYNSNVPDWLYLGIIIPSI